MMIAHTIPRRPPVPTPRIAITMEADLLAAVDHCVGEGRYPNRSRAIQAAVRLMSRLWRRRRLREALALVDPEEARRWAEETFEGDLW